MKKRGGSGRDPAPEEQPGAAAPSPVRRSQRQKAPRRDPDHDDGDGSVNEDDGDGSDNEDDGDDDHQAARKHINAASRSSLRQPGSSSSAAEQRSSGLATSSTGGSSSAPLSVGSGASSSSSQASTALAASSDSSSQAADNHAREAAQLRAKELLKLTKQDLVSKCADSGVATSGNKPHLVARIISKLYPQTSFSVDDVTSLKPSKSQTLAVTQGNASGWERLIARPTRIVEREEVLRESMPRLGHEAKRIAYRAFSAADALSSKTRNASFPTRVFCAIADELFGVILKQMGPHGAAFSFETAEVSQAVGLLLEMGLSAKPVDTKFPADVKMTKERLLQVAHAITGFGARPGSRAEVERGSWQASASQMQRWKDALKAFAVGNACIVDTFSALCLDDDLINFAGSMVGGSSTKTVIHHEGEGQSLDVSVWVALNVVASIRFRSSGGSPLRDFIDELPANVRFATYDRYYTRVATSGALSAKGCRCLGILHEGYASQQAFTCLDAGSTLSGYKEGEAGDVLARESGASFDVVSFVGCGPRDTAAINGDGTVVYASVNRLALNKPGVVLACEGNPVRDAQGNISASKLAAVRLDAARRAATFVRIPGHSSRAQHIPLLESAPESDETAVLFKAHFLAVGVIGISAMQGDSAWGWARRLKDTGSTAGLVMPKAFKAYPGRWNQVEALLRGQQGSAAEDGPGDPTYESLVSDMTSGEAAQAQIAVAAAPPAIVSSVLDDVDVGADSSDVFESTVEGLEGSLGITQSSAQDDEDETPAPPPQAPAATAAPPATTTDQASLAARVVEAITRSHLQAFSGSAATAEGHIQERRAQCWVKEVHGVSGSVFTAGFMSRLDHPEVGVSPDMLCQIFPAGASEPVLAVVEHKSSKFFSPDAIAARAPKSIDAGSSEYFVVVPWRFRAQLATQAAVLGVRHVLLLYSALTGPAASYLISYSQEQLDQVWDLLTNQDVTGFLHDLHVSMLDTLKTTDQLMQLVPVTLPTLTRKAIASWLPATAALARYRHQLGKPVPPTYVFRSAVVDEYDANKGGVDTVDRQISEMTRAGASTIKFSIESKITLRLIYYCVVNAWSLAGLYMFMEELLRDKTPVAANQVLGALTLKALRLGMRKKTGTIADFCSRLGLELAQHQIPLGLLAVGAVEPAPPLLAPSTPVQNGPIEVWGYRPDVLRRVLQIRASAASRSISHVDFVPGTRLVVASGTFSLNTPGHRILHGEGFSEEAGSRLAEAWNASKQSADDAEASGGSGRKGRGQARLKRLAMWDELGLRLRVSIIVCHERVPMVTRGRCLLCDRRSVTMAQCATCCAILCTSNAPNVDDELTRPCFDQFHLLGGLQQYCAKLAAQGPPAAASSAAAGSSAGPEPGSAAASSHGGEDGSDEEGPAPALGSGSGPGVQGPNFLSQTP